MGALARIRFLGGTREVGRSAFALEVDGVRILLDYGVAIDHEPAFPGHIAPRDVDAIILSHAHLDHSGGIPLFYVGGARIPVYGTELTFELTDLLLKDFLNLSGPYLPYEYVEVRAMLANARYVNFGETFEIGSVEAQLINAGHIPGSAQVIIRARGGKTIVYTSDINTLDTRLLNGAETNYGEADAVIIEATYANEDHPNRAELEERFVERCREIVEAGGTVLVPAFSVGRSQEALCILKAKGFEYPIVMDGMALHANEIMLRHPRFFRDYELLKSALSSVRWIFTKRERKEVVRSPCVIISPAGMLKGGPAHFYMGEIAKRPNCAIFLVSYQVPGTPGRLLLEQRKMRIGGKLVDVAAEVERFDFSSHCGRRELEQTLKSVKGSPKVFVVHGSSENCQTLANWVREEMGLEAYAPLAGEFYEI